MFREPGDVPGELDPAAADVVAVQGALQDRAQFVDEPYQRLGLGELVVGGADRGRPLGLFVGGRPVGVPEVLGGGAADRGSCLAAQGAVGVEAEQEVPGGTGADVQVRVEGDPFRDTQRAGGADAFVGVRPGDDEDVAHPGPVESDGEQMQRAALPRPADHPQGAQPRPEPDERGGRSNDPRDAGIRIDRGMAHVPLELLSPVVSFLSSRRMTMVLAMPSPLSLYKSVTAHGS
ncbi:hypothetical protein SBRY_110176 [Actinacidiphila bryophytorum]|uniref:Uncharacterized protein n=1 Tax=Actinacidiphila bryophytorum TaxID=1436133 RepID=A0A9W4E827_9ACTN|nr:hypothetical protein SBRY_110176 [Actinacidiphila bryophytorum]